MRENSKPRGYELSFLQEAIMIISKAEKQPMKISLYQKSMNDWKETNYNSFGQCSFNENFYDHCCLTQETIWIGILLCCKTVRPFREIDTNFIVWWPTMIGYWVH